MPFSFFNKKKRSIQDEEIEQKIAEISRPATIASQRATKSIDKLNKAIVKEDIALNLYYATHPKGAGK